FMAYDIIYMLPENRFKIQFICYVKICRHCFRVTVDHDGFITTFRSCQYPMNTTVIKFDSLAYTIRTRAEHHHLLFITYLTLILYIAMTIFGFYFSFKS